MELIDMTPTELRVLQKNIHSELSLREERERFSEKKVREQRLQEIAPQLKRLRERVDKIQEISKSQTVFISLEVEVEVNIFPNGDVDFHQSSDIALEDIYKAHPELEETVEFIQRETDFISNEVKRLEDENEIDCDCLYDEIDPKSIIF